MPVPTKLQSRVTEPRRAILKSSGNRIAVTEEPKHKKKETQRNPQGPKKQVSEISDSIVQSNVSLDSTCSSDSSSSNSSGKKVNSTSRKTVKRNGFKPLRVVSNAVDVSPPAKASTPSKKCDWITPNSDPLYIAFHDEEWGVPVDDDIKLFELLVFSQALAEHSWPAILNHRDIFRKFFENFEPSSIAKFTEKKLLLTQKINGIPLLSEPKLRAIVENAKQLLKVQQEFGSFSNYCWRFVNNKPIRNEYRYGRQVPVKTPKAEVISKDMMRRGFQCVGPTVVYSFMQVAGLVNDHLSTCFRYHECNNVTTKNELKTEVNEKKVQEDETSKLTQIQ